MQINQFPAIFMQISSVSIQDFKLDENPATAD